MASGDAASRRLFPREGPDDDGGGECAEVEPVPDAGAVWAYLDVATGDLVLTLTDDARGVLRLRPRAEEHEAVMQTLLTAACSGARSAVDEDTRTWWAAVARQGQAVLDHMSGAALLPRVAADDGQ